MHKGFGLIELLAALSIAAIVSMIALPNLNYLFDNNQIRQVSRQLYQSIDFAKQVSREKHHAVTLCPLSTTQQCSTNWEDPVAIFIDSNQNLTLDKDEQLLYQTHLNASQVLVSWSGAFKMPYLQFKPSGMAINGSILLCHLKQKQLNKKLIINRVGRIRTESMTSCS